MKRNVLFLAGLLLLGLVSARLVQRLREERIDTNVTLLAEWADVREEAARTDLSDTALLEMLRQSGVNALVISESLVKDYLARGMTFSSRAEATLVQHQLTSRGVQNVQVQTLGRRARLVRQGANWEPIKELSLGYDPALLSAAHASGLQAVLRMSHDPWVSATQLFQDLEEIFAAGQAHALLFNSDVLPSGLMSASTWVNFMRDRMLLNLLPEFKATKASRQLAAKLPLLSYRTHSITANEYKDLSPDQERARWERAIRERSSRFLLVRSSPDDSLEGYLGRLRAVHAAIEGQGFVVAWPKIRAICKVPSSGVQKISAILALLLAIATPALALRAGLGKSPWRSFVVIALVALAGASMVSVLADNPLTRIQVVPFRGVKLAFLLGWLGCFALLFSPRDIALFLSHPLRRLDVLLLIAGAGVLGYLVLRTGNSGGAWKVGWEQQFRNTLEQIFIARPRFKEFAIGYPLLILGLHSPKAWWGKVLIGIGMIGPISMINTFCHLHSPLLLAYLRSANGLLLGSLFGTLLLKARPWLTRF